MHLYCTQQSPVYKLGKMLISLSYFLLFLTCMKLISTISFSPAFSCLNCTLELPSSCYDVEKDTLAFTKVDAFLPGKIYYQGCLKAFLQITKWNGPEVLRHGQLALSQYSVTII